MKVYDVTSPIYCSVLRTRIEYKSAWHGRAVRFHQISFVIPMAITTRM